MPKEQIAGLTIHFEPNAAQGTVDAIHAGLSAYNRRVLGDEQYTPLRWIARDADGQVAAGLLGDLYFNWLYIAILWVREDQRGRGIGSRLMALADVFDALTCKRVYKPAFSFDDAYRIIVDSRGQHFDPDVVDAFISDFETFKTIASNYAE